MEVFDCIRRRRSVRKFKKKSFDKQTLFEILEAARYAPCPGNIQNWRFIVVDDREVMKKVARATLQPEVFTYAPYAVVVCSDSEKIERQFPQRGQLYAIQSVAAAIENILLAATARGIGTLWIGSFANETVVNVLKIEGVDVHAILVFGYPDEPTSKLVKADLAHLTYINVWKSKDTLKPILPLARHVEKAAKGVKKLAKKVLKKK